ncbi:MAG: hypothetical protein ABIK98_10160 [Pseudomonadota bacterium]|uniref:Uncharacterized protein n=1 Tax=Candidatus Desulfatibia profunda TaxID=2841695 RepID=A0A8J6TJQ6_9BACT|nr:hypothetical protein [Candidatus Desulfatibia profunda]MBL7178655.1 hypothetical protein [Desulfobacterales bacterium]
MKDAGQKQQFISKSKEKIVCTKKNGMQFECATHIAVLEVICPATAVPAAVVEL